MAIYYIDPHITTNGTGTWSSPWSCNSSIRAGLATGDEIRIKGIPLTNLLTPTTYTATNITNYQLTITNGGGLGADFALGDVCYLPEYDTFFKVYGSTSDVISLGSSTSMLPISNTAATTVTLRKVNLTTYPPSASSTTVSLAGLTILNNITISDGWIDATTRVTDGTVKTLLHSSIASNSQTTLFLDSGTTGNPTGWTVNLNNTHALCGNGATSTNILARIYGSNSTYNINQLFGHYNAVAAFAIGDGSTSSALNNTVTTKSVQCGPIIQSNFSRNLIFNITYYISYYSDYMFGSNYAGLGNSSEYTFNIENVIAQTFNAGLISLTQTGKGTINYTNGFEFIGNTNIAPLISGATGLVQINFGPTITFKRNKRTITQTTFPVGYSNTGTAYPGKSVIPNISTPAGCTITTLYGTFSTPVLSSINRSYMNPMVINYEFASIPTTLPSGTTYYNVLITARDGGAPVELLGPQNYAYTTSLTPANMPKVTTDATVYKSTGPSLKSYLNTRLSLIWRYTLGYYQPVAVKNIKIPVITGSNYTVTGWIRTDDTVYQPGDCRAAIIVNNAELVGQNMTTGCINNWERFTLSFTAPYTGEVLFAWEMYYSNGDKSYWLDDLTIS